MATTTTVRPIRCVVIRGIKYLRADDVGAYLRELAGTEETDTRRRLNAAATNLTQQPEAH